MFLKYLYLNMIEFIEFKMEKIIQVFKSEKKNITSRLNEFSRFYIDSVSWFFENNEMKLKPVDTTDNERIFEELTFCLLTANTSAVMGLKGVDSVRPVLINGSYEQIRDKLVSGGYRFPNKRAEYIIEAREKFKTQFNFDFKSLIDNKKPTKVRQFFVNNVKGLGYKESSHFLRNIGVFGLAILDKHIIRTMHEYNLIEEIPKSLNKKRYLEFEEKYIKFADKIGINMDELDLLLWSMKNGRILK